MTKQGVNEERGALTVHLDMGSVPPERLNVCARLLARLLVEKALEKRGLDSDRAMCSNVGNPHKSGPAGADNTDRA